MQRWGGECWYRRLHREVDAFVRYISPTPVEDEIRSLVVLQIQRCISNKFPDAKVRSFGSYETKLYLPLGFVFPLLSTIQPFLIAYNNTDSSCNL